MSQRIPLKVVNHRNWYMWQGNTSCTQAGGGGAMYNPL